MRQFNQSILTASLSQYGVNETVGSKHDPEVMQYYKDCGHAWVDNDELPWCAAFVGAMLYRVGREGTGKLNARSYEDWGFDVTTNPKVGDIVVLWRQNKTCGKGHIGFYIREDDTHVYMLGGNQGNKFLLIRKSFDSSGKANYRNCDFCRRQHWFTRC